MAAEPNAVEQAVSRTLRDNLERVQRTADELHQAVNDLVSACASTRPSNALPSMLRVQTSAASLSATLEVLSRFVTSALQPAMRLPFEPEILRMPSLSAPPVSFEQPPPIPSHPIEEAAWSVPAPAMPDSPAAETLPPVLEPAAAAEVHEAAPVIPPVSAASWETPAASAPEEPMELGTWDAPASAAPLETLDAGSFDPPVAPPQVSLPEFSADLPVEEYSQSAAPSEVEQREAGPAFNLDLLPPEEQELHRRAFRVAKVSMQDIRMLASGRRTGGPGK